MPTKLIVLWMILGAGCAGSPPSQEGEERAVALPSARAPFPESLAGLAGPVCRAFPAIDALITSVDVPMALVTISKGRDARIQPGFEFFVYRDSVYKAYVRIVEVGAQTSTAIILGSVRSPIQVGDDVATCL